jgi:predicted phosphodiesterase
LESKRSELSAMGGNMARLAAAVLVLTLGGPAPPSAGQSIAADRVVGGPYAVNVSQQSATVMWIVQTGEASLGSEPGKADMTAPILRAEKAVFAGLRAGTTYYYQAFPGPDGGGSFKTPPSGPAKFQFVVLGDTRTRHDVHRSVIAAILEHAAPDFVVHTGDLVADGNNVSLWPVFFDAERELLRKAAFYPSLGNHERNADNYLAFLNARPFYSFDWGGAHFTVLNSDIASAGQTPAQRDAYWKEETRWLEEDLGRAQKAGLRFVIAHHPPITAVKRRQGNNAHMTALEPVFEKFRVTAGFFGHDHNYQHYLKNGIHYFTTGGGGAPLYDVDVPPADITIKVASTENFMVVQVDGNTARFEARTPDGESIDITDLKPPEARPARR